MEIARSFLDRSEKVKGTLQFFIGNLLSASSGRLQEKSPDRSPVIER
jgi:hypothetical protein